MKTTYTRWPLSDLALTLGAVYMAGIATGAADAEDFDRDIFLDCGVVRFFHGCAIWFFEGRRHGYLLNTSVRACMRPPLLLRFCCNEPNRTSPIPVANSGWSRADFSPLIELVLPR